MTSELLESVRINAQSLVSKGLLAYEVAFGKLKVDLSRQRFLSSGLRLLNVLLDRVGANEQVSIFPLKSVLINVLSDLDFDIETVQNLLPFVLEEVLSFLRSKPTYDANIAGSLKTYFALIGENAGDFAFYSSSEATDILRAQPEYQYSEALYSVTPLEYNNSSGKVYTLFTEERYWEVFSSQTDTTSYSPLGYNRFATQLGLSQYRIPVSYSPLVVFEGELYKLRPEVTSPRRDYFDNTEWVKYSSRLFNNAKSFRNVLKSNVRDAFGKFTEAGFDSNEIISDSKVAEYSKTQSVDENLLPSTFGGVGKQLLDSIKDLKNLSDSFGSYEGSPVGGVDYITRVSEYLFASCFGRSIPEIFSLSGGDSAFGRFDVLYKASPSPNKMPGLKFLDPFGSLRSFVHSQKVPEGTVEASGKLIYNPVYSQFYDGLEDRFDSLEEAGSYSEPPSVDILLYSLESIYRRSLIVGDTVKAVVNSLDERGRIPGYEGLGSVRVQMEEFQRVFPPGMYFLDYGYDSIRGGLTGSIKYLLDNYSRFSAATVKPVLPGKSLEFFGTWVESISGKVGEILDVMRGVGISTSEFIPNISFKAYEASDRKLVEFLRSLGFRDSEVDKLLQVESFSQLVSNFAPISDSSDLKSFFKAYELAQLVYEFGGQEAVDAYLSFLYTSGSVDSLLNILKLSEKDKSRLTSININRYPKLIGLLIGLTYAVDPGQLVKFNKILGKNNLTLLESISFIYQNGESTIIKNKQDVQILQPLVEQMITGVYKDDAFATPTMTYEQANSVVPIALKQWTKIIGDNLGNVGSLDIIDSLYDKARGLTPKELFSVLNGPSSPTELGHVLDGFSGGVFTSFLRYASLAGLGVKLSNYKNSCQVNNFQVDTENKTNALLRIVDNLEEFSKYLSIVKNIFSSELDYNFSYTSDFSKVLEPLVLSQNKTYGTLPQLVSSMAVGSSMAGMTSVASTAPISESPGVGNSRLPNRVPAKNSVTSEQATAIAGAMSEALSTEMVDGLPINLVCKFIKFSEANLLANTVLLPDETVELQAAGATTKPFSPATRYELDTPVQRVPSKPRSVPPVYTSLDGGPDVRSQALGSNYISTSSSDPPGSKSFDPVASCRRFGGSNCEDLYSSSQQRCVGRFNKSLFPETYSDIPGVPPSKVAVDRPLGTFAEYVPTTTMVPTSAFDQPASFMSLLPPDTLVGERGEPLLTTILSDHLVYESGGAELSEYGNTEFGVVEFLKAKMERGSEFNCAGFDSPFHYQICMNVMKCKRFSPPYEGKYYLAFCPKTLSGGKLK